jgi:hypothetical protein
VAPPASAAGRCSPGAGRSWPGRGCCGDGCAGLAGCCTGAGAGASAAAAGCCSGRAGGPGRGPGRGPLGRADSPAGAGATGCSGCSGCRRGGPGTAPPPDGPGTAAGPAPWPPGRGCPPPGRRRAASPEPLPFDTDSRSLRATGASTVEDGDFTYSPRSCNLLRTCLLLMPSSLASSCTRALPATALLVTRRPAADPARPQTWCRSTFMVRSSRLAHDGSTLLPSVTDPGVSRAPCAVLVSAMVLASPAVLPATMPARTAAVSSGPGTRNARGNAERRSARCKHFGTGCNHAPRPRSRRRGSGVSTPSTTTIRNRPSADARFRHPTQVRTGSAADACSGAGVGRAGLEPERRASVECSAGSLRPLRLRILRSPFIDVPLRTPTLRVRSLRKLRSVCPFAPQAPLSRPTPTRSRPAPHAGRRRCGCRCANRSTGRPTGRSGPPCRWRARAGSPAPRRARSSCARRAP